MEENKIYQNDNPKNGPLDGVQLRTDCVRTKFTQKRQKTGYPFKQSQTKANVSASVETGTFSIRDVQTNIMLANQTRRCYGGMCSRSGCEQKGGRMYGNEGRCRSCGAKIRFVKMKSGKSMPVNEKIVNYQGRPSWQGKNCDTGRRCSRRVTDINADEATGFGYVSHFATCPNARNHRR